MRRGKSILGADLFGEGGHVWEFSEAFGAGYADHGEIAGKDIRLLVGGHAKAAGDMASEEGCGDFMAAGVADMGEIDAGERLQQAAHEQALRGEGSVGGIIVLSGGCLGCGHKLVDGLDAGVGVYGEAQPHIGDLHHSAEVGQRIAGLLDLRRGREGGYCREAEGIAVGTGLGHVEHGGGPRAAGLADDVQRDLVLVLKVLGQDAGCDIHGSAGAERDNDGNGPIGIRGGSGARQAGQQQGADEEGAKQGLKLLHGLFLARVKVTGKPSRRVRMPVRPEWP